MRRLSGVAVVMSLALAVVAPGGASAARLVGGREEAAIVHAFEASPSHRQAAIASVRRSSAAPDWAVVRWVAPELGGRTTSRAVTPRLRSSFYRRTAGGAELAGSPPGAVAAELNAAMSVAVVYRGSGSESIQYSQLYRSVCQGLGGFTDTEDVTVSPMKWTVRYVVRLDDLVASVGGSGAPALVPVVSFDAGGSSLDAVESLTRTTVDVGCNNKPSTVSCRMTFRLDAPPSLSLVAGAGLEVGIPMNPVTSGQCSPESYTLGPSLFDSGATTALVPTLDMLGGLLPANPYAAVAVSWPDSSAGEVEGFVTSPCQGDPACQDRMAWRGTVTLQALS